MKIKAASKYIKTLGKAIFKVGMGGLSLVAGSLLILGGVGDYVGGTVTFAKSLDESGKHEKTEQDA